jgi:nitrate/TMAO reductase-like tetraheme cytochrome c subunit
MPVWIIAACGALVAALALLVGFRPHVTRSREGKILAFVALLILPLVFGFTGFSEQMRQAQSTEFCLSCHVMTDYGRTLRIDDPGYLPAQHFQNNRIPRDRACYTCHTTYTMFGGVNAKLKGVRHLWVQYLGSIPKPGEIKLYEPYNNRECLHCHLGARRFEQASPHQKTPDLLTRAKSGQLSCMASGCHDIVHDVSSLKDAPMWKGGA